MHQTVPQPQLGGRGADRAGGARRWAAAARSTPWSTCAARREDYDGWAAAARQQRRVVATRTCCRTSPALEGNARFNDDYHGIGGNLRVSEPGHISRHDRGLPPAPRRGWGIAYNPDFNGARQNGVGIMQHTYGQWGRYKERSDAKKAFLDPLAGDRRLTIVTERAGRPHPHRERPRRRASPTRRTASAHEARAGREVLVAAGTYNTRQAADAVAASARPTICASTASPVVADLPGVGQNLQDHHEVPVIATTKGKSGYFGEDRAGRCSATACNTCCSTPGR